MVVAEWLTKNNKEAFVFPATHGGLVTVYAEECTEQDPQVLGNLTAVLTKELKCAGLTVLNHDDDFLLYELYKEGLLVDKYISPPFFEPGDEEDSVIDEEDDVDIEWKSNRGDAVTLCAVMGTVDATETVQAVLGSTDYVFQTERHKALVEAMGLPDNSAGLGFLNLLHDEDLLPEGFIQTGNMLP